jgi:hypothetical protein
MTRSFLLNIGIQHASLFRYTEGNKIANKGVTLGQPQVKEPLVFHIEVEVFFIFVDGAVQVYTVMLSCMGFLDISTEMSPVQYPPKK